jgi:hypothetical protein
MQCPFPGMDPYLERSGIWPDVHNSLIICLRDMLPPLLRRGYAALLQHRRYVVESDHPISPDVSLVRTRRAVRTSGTDRARPDRAVVIELFREEIRQPVLHIIEPAAGNRIVTAIEVLNPDNKVAGAGRESYLQKGDELWQAGANLVEIDLLRRGRPTVRVPKQRLEALRPFAYVVAVSRWFPSQYEVYKIGLREALPKVAVPLSNGDPDVTLDLPAAFARCWETGAYADLLPYDKAPAGLSRADVAWCRKQLREAGLLRRGKG